MTVAIKESLNKMYVAIESLERTAVQAQDNAKKNVERAVKKSPPDLFSVPATGGAQGEVDTKALASRLDSAIAKVETLLREGA